MQYSLFSLSVFVAVCVALSVALFSWKKQTDRDRSFTWLATSITVWTLFYFLELSVSDIWQKTILTNFAYFGITATPVFFFQFSVGFTGRTLKQSNLLWLIPLVTITAVWTNTHHHFFRTSVGLEYVAGLIVLTTELGWLFWVHAVYSYALLAFGSFLLLKELASQPAKFRGQITFLLVAVAIPWLANLFYLSGITPWPQLDVTPFAFTVTVVMVFLAIFRFDFLDIKPVARNLVFENLLEGIFVLDKTGRIVDANRSALVLLNADHDEVIGHAATDVFSSTPDLVEKYQFEHDITDHVVVSIAEDARHLEIRISPIQTAAGETTGRILSVRDISQQKETEIRLHNARLAADVANQAKNQFLSNISHEIRTPLNGINGSCELLKASEPLSPTQSGYVDMLQHCVDDFVNLLDRILGMSEMIAEPVVLTPDIVELKAVVQNISDQFQTRARSKDLELVTRLDDRLPSTVYMDRAQVETVLEILTSNAIKFTEAGRITIFVAMEGETKIRLGVTDTGIGMTVDEKRRMSEIFSQVDTSNTRVFGGVGLGLAMATKILESMESLLEISSLPEIGTEASFVLDL